MYHLATPLPSYIAHTSMHNWAGEGTCPIQKFVKCLSMHTCELLYSVLSRASFRIGANLKYLKKSILVTLAVVKSGDTRLLLIPSTVCIYTCVEIPPASTGAFSVISSFHHRTGMIKHFLGVDTVSKDSAPKI